MSLPVENEFQYNFPDTIKQAQEVIFTRKISKEQLIPLVYEE